MTDNEVLFVRSAKKSGSKSTEGDSSTNDDVWDDTLLIKAYDKAVQIAKESYMNKKQNLDSTTYSKGKKGTEQKWKVGDKCRCQYSEDMRYYEADIIEIFESTGMCNVRYVGYENEEKIPLKKLKPSKGEAARVKQFKAAAAEKEDQNFMEVETDVAGSSGSKSQPVQKKAFKIKKDKCFDKRNGFSDNSFKSLNFPLPHIANSVIPPPPPPDLFSRLGEDENETEAMSAMLISWYMSGYHTGYYQGLKMAKQQSQN